MDNLKTYGPKRVCEAVGISYRQLGYWGLIGVIKPNKRIHGSKIFNHYTDEDIETLIKVRKLTEEGFFVGKAAEKVSKEAAEGPIEDHTKEIVTSKENNREGLSSYLYLEARLNEELTNIRQSYRPLSCMAIQILFPPQFNFPHEKNGILYQLSKTLISHKQPSEVLCYERDSLFLWLLPNKTLDDANLFSNELKREIEEMPWELPKRTVKLSALFGLSRYSFSSKNGANLLTEAEKNLQSNQRSPMKSGTGRS